MLKPAASKDRNRSVSQPCCFQGEAWLLAPAAPTSVRPHRHHAQPVKVASRTKKSCCEENTQAALDNSWPWAVFVAHGSPTCRLAFCQSSTSAFLHQHKPGSIAQGRRGSQDAGAPRRKPSHKQAATGLDSMVCRCPGMAGQAWAIQEPLPCAAAAVWMVAGYVPPGERNRCWEHRYGRNCPLPVNSRRYGVCACVSVCVCV